jgi:hypothetical protein
MLFYNIQRYCPIIYIIINLLELWILKHYSDHWITRQRYTDRIAEMFVYLQDQRNKEYSITQLFDRRFESLLKKEYDNAIEFYETNKICIKDKNLNIV